MHRTFQPIENLAALAVLNGVDFHDNAVAIKSLLPKERNTGVVANRTLPGESDNAVLMSIPQDLVLSMENVWVYAKADKELREVLEGLGDYARTARGAILTFLLVQVTHNATGGAVGAAGFFNNYIQYLPNNFPLPTFWDDQERSLVQGTSLETALSSKLSSLDREFSLLRGKTSSITWCQQHWWDPAMGLLSIEDWKAVDAMYRSRALDLPGKGHAVVPFIDMANHASGDCTVALYETDSDGNALLLLRDGKTLNTSEEVTITYGDEKGACEMLFSYGFLEENMRSCRELFLELNIPEDDPLKLAKKRVSKTAPGFRLFDREGVTDWEGPYIWLLCVNEEDGLEFKLLQRTDGDTDVQALWKGREIEDMIQLQDLLRGDAMKDVFLLRAISILQSRVEDQLVRMENSKNLLLPMRQENENHVGSYPNIMKLRDLEETLLLQAYEEFEDQKTTLCGSQAVQQYLESVNNDRQELASDEDFS